MCGHNQSFWVRDGCRAPHFGQLEEYFSCVEGMKGIYALWIIRNWVSRQVSYCYVSDFDETL